MLENNQIVNSLNRIYERYGVAGSLRLLLDKLYTWTSFPQARLIRRPFYIRGRRWIELAPGLTTGPGLRLDAFPPHLDSPVVLKIGRDVQLNDYVHIAALHSVTIGHRVLIASKVFITDHSHGRYRGEGEHDSPLVAPADRVEPFAPVVIEDDVWLGEGVAVLPGVRIGKGSIIGALSVVNQDVPEYAIAVGSPARVIKRYNFETTKWERC